LLNKSL